MEQEIVVFNRETERKEGGAFMVLDTRDIKKCHIRMNRFASRMMELNDNSFLEFIKIDGQWYIHPTILKIGYKLLPQGGTGEYRIHCKIFILELLHELRYSDPIVRFKIKKVNGVEYKGEKIFLIDHSRSLKHYSWTELNT